MLLTFSNMLGVLMSPDYKNWVPKGMLYGFAAGTIVLGAAEAAVWTVGAALRRPLRNVACVGLGVGLAGCALMTAWSAVAHRRFSYEGKRQLARSIVEGTASYVRVPSGGTCLDVGCGSGALTIAVAKRNPMAEVVGIDLWGAEYASFTKELCERNARSECVDNVRFEWGDARKLAFDDETFDAVTSNYVYHNIAGEDKQDLLRETLRTLRKGGSFAIHDLMGPARYGDMQAFANELREQGYQHVELIPTANGRFMERFEGQALMLSDSMLLTGTK